MIKPASSAGFALIKFFFDVVRQGFNADFRILRKGHGLLGGDHEIFFEYLFAQISELGAGYLFVDSLYLFEFVNQFSGDLINHKLFKLLITHEYCLGITISINDDKPSAES